MNAAEGMDVGFVAGWADPPQVAVAFGDYLWPVWALACAESRKAASHVLFTAHSVPCRTIMTGEASLTGSRPGTPPQLTPDPYPVEAKRTAQLVADCLAPVGFSEKDWFFAFQSQGMSGGPWIGPTVEDTLKAIKDEGHAGVVMQPVGFLCDHVEILYDIDIAFTQGSRPRTRPQALWRAESLNDSPLLVQSLKEIVTGNYHHHPTPPLETAAPAALLSFALSPSFPAKRRSLQLLLSLPVLAVACSRRCLFLMPPPKFVILSEAKNPRICFCLCFCSCRCLFLPLFVLTPLLVLALALALTWVRGRPGFKLPGNQSAANGLLLCRRGR